MKKSLSIIILLLLNALSLTSADQQISQKVGIVEKLGQTIPMDENFYDENGNLVQLKSIINKPTIVTFVYFKCTGICSPLLNEVTDVINKMDLELGKDYQILTLSFDNNEKPEMAKEKRENYLGEIKKPIDPSGWRFFTGDSVNIHRLTDAAGFYFQRNGNEWIHAATLIMISPQGKITRYLYGINHLPFDVKMAVIEASEGIATPTIAKMLRFCYSYDPEGHRYAFNFMRISFIIIIMFVVAFVYFLLIRPRMKNSGKASNI